MQSQMRLLFRITEIWALLAAFLLLAIVLVTSTNVAAFSLDRLARIWGGTVSGLPGYEDFVTLTISAVALMFLPYCQVKKGHVVVPLFTSFLSDKIRLILDRIWLLTISFVAIFLAIYMTMGMFEARSDGTVAGVLGWPEWPFYAPGILSLILWAVVALGQAIFPRKEDDLYVGA